MCSAPFAAAFMERFGIGFTMVLAFVAAAIRVALTIFWRRLLGNSVEAESAAEEGCQAVLQFDESDRVRRDPNYIELPLEWRSQKTAPNIQ